MTALVGSEIISVLIGRQIVTQAISDASNSIYHSITGLVLYSDDVNGILSELDLGSKIKILEELLKCLSNYKKKNSIIDMTLEQLHDMVLQIKRDLHIISEKLKNHNEKWFSNYRKVNCKKELAKLKIHSKILDNRLELFFKSINLKIE